MTATRPDAIRSSRSRRSDRIDDNWWTRAAITLNIVAGVALVAGEADRLRFFADDRAARKRVRLTGGLDGYRHGERTPSEGLHAS